MYKRSSDGSLIGLEIWTVDTPQREIFWSVISWLSRKQPVIALSTTEAEYITLCAATQETIYIWIGRLLTDIKAPSHRPTTIREDNQIAIAIAKNPISHARTKHIDVKFHFVNEALMY